MAELATLARPYAKASFEIARQAGDDGVARWERMLSLLAAAIEAPEVARQVSSPALLPGQKAEMLGELIADELDESGRNLLRVLADNKRLELLPEIHRQFAELRAAWERTLDVEIVSAYPLDDDDTRRLAERLSKRFEREIAVSSRVDEHLLGGVVIRAGDTVIDGSLRGRLDKLAEQLRARG